MLSRVRPSGHRKLAEPYTPAGPLLFQLSPAANRTPKPVAFTTTAAPRVSPIRCVTTLGMDQGRNIVERMKMFHAPSYRLSRAPSTDNAFGAPMNRAGTRRSVHRPNIRESLRSKAAHRLKCSDVMREVLETCLACGGHRTRIIGQSGQPPVLHRRCEECGHVFSRPLDDGDDVVAANGNTAPSIGRISGRRTFS
jgi:hypothetical protein